MKAQNFVLSKPWYRSDGPYGYVTGLWHKVTPGALVKGNCRDPNNWSYDVFTETSFNGNVWYYYKHRLMYTVSGNLGAGARFSDTNPLPSWDRVTPYNGALSRLNDEVRGNLDLSVALGELGSTKRMVKSVLTFERFIGKFSKKTLANAWLELQYGWRPLVGDIYAAADESVNFVLNRLQRYKARYTLPLTDPKSYTWTIYNTPCAVRREKRKGISSCTIGLELYTPDFDLARWTSLNPLSIAWELTPYSFVCDWFYDLGGYLRNLETGLLYNTRFKSGYKSELYFWESDEVAPMGGAHSAGDNGWKVLSGAKQRTRRVQFQRTKLTSYPLPHLPRLDAKLGSSRLLSAAALLTQKLR